MKTSKSKKVLSLIMAVIMMFTVVPATIFAQAEDNYPIMKSYSTSTAMNSEDYHLYKAQVVTVTFLDKIDKAAAENAAYSFDVSANMDKTVMAWMVENEEETALAGETRYDVYIAGDGGVGANANSSNVFFNFVNLKEVNGLENFKTGNATTIDCFFEKCSSLESVDLSSFDTSNVTNLSWLFSDCNSLESVNFSGWDTQNVTNMSFMFNNCLVLPMLDLSNFNTKKVTNMMKMFYRCEKLTTLYTGDDWSVEQVTSSAQMFNCCYIIKGEKSFSEVPAPYDKQYATYGGGFLTYKEPAPAEYTVTYEFVGDVIPDGVVVPTPYKYNAGAEISVETAPTAEGYVFSGWSTDDATVTDGSFTVNNDVHFVGSWEKLYKVEYKYTEGYEVPADAPALPDATYYKAGEEVDKYGVPYVYRYVFVGWTTDDADISGDIFTMPENDVVIYGYFKIPVESVEVMNTEDIVLNVDDATGERINVYVNPEDATIKDIIYESGDETVAKVDKYGNVTPVGPGETTITVASKDDPTKSDTIKVTVKYPVTDITVDKTEIELKPDTTDKITVTVVPENATNKKVTYKSNDETIVKVDENGNITAVGEGTTTITITSDDNSKVTETVEVTVKTPVESITVPENPITLYPDEIKNIGATVNDDATNKELIYESENSGVVKVDDEGNIIPRGTGTTTIKITSVDNPDISTTVTVTVVPRQYNVTYEFIGEVQPENVKAPDAATYDEGTTVDVKPDASAEGYTFSGWSTDDVAVADGKFVINNDVHFVGSWTKNPVYYNVEYKYEGDVPANAPTYETKTYLEGTNVTVESTPSVDGYIFSGWSTEDADITSGNFDIYKDVVISGTWTKLYNVTYEYEGDVPENAPAVPDKESYKAGAIVDVENAPSLEGYTFSGWSTSDATVADGEFTMPEKDVLLKGRWTKINYYNVEYKYEGDVPENAPAVPDKESYEEGTNVIVENAPSVDGYIFSGWSTEDADITNGNFDIHNNVTIIGTWTKLYNVTYEYEGVVPENAPAVPDKESYKAGTIVDVENAPSLEGYTFSGWSTSDATVADGEFTMPEKDVLLKGKWTKINYYNVEYKYEGDVPANAPAVPNKESYEEGTNVIVENAPSVDGYKFLGWTSKDANISNGNFDIHNNVTIIGRWEILPGPVTSITAPDKLTLVLGQDSVLEAYVNSNAVNKGLYFISNNEDIVKIDETGKMTTVGAGTALITIASVENPAIYKVVEITVTAKPFYQTKHYIVFGKTEKIGWYSVSLDGGKTFFTQFGNDHLEVEHGTEIIVRANDVFGDPFTFYINGDAATPDENGYVRVLVDQYILIGALGIPVIAPDAEESLNLIQKIIKAIKDFFAKIVALFKF